MDFKILGRDPLLWLTMVAVAIQLVATFNVGGLSPEQAALWITAIYAVFAVINAFMVRPVTPEVFTYAVGALAALAAGYGFNLSAEQVGLVAGLVLAAVALSTREKISPVETPLTHA